MSRSDFTIGTHQLCAIEVLLIRTFVRLYDHDESYNWVFQASGPCDAMIVNGTALSSMPPNKGGRSPAILSIVSAGEGKALNTLARPISADQLQNWLKTAANQLRISSCAAALTQTPPLQTAVTQLQTRFKLRRWPQSALVRNDPVLIRMSTLLSRRSLLLTELAELSQQSLERCTQFIESLQPVGLLDIEHVSVILSFPPVQATGSSPGTKRPFGKNLISGIRRRLGL